MLKKKGFTLIELLIVMVIMAILVAIVIGLIGQSATNRAKDVDAKSAMREIQTALEMHMADYGEYPDTLDEGNLELGADVRSCDECDRIIYSGPQAADLDAGTVATTCYKLTYNELSKPSDDIDEHYTLECKQ